MERLVRTVSNALMWVACLAITLMMLHVTFDVFGKYVFRTPVPATFEAVEVYYMVWLVFLPFAYVARGEGQIFVELFTRSLKPRVMGLIDVGAGVLALVWLLLLVWYSGEEAVTMTQEGEFRQISEGFIYMWPSRWVIPIGCAAMALAVVARIGQDLSTAIRDR